MRARNMINMRFVLAFSAVIALTASSRAESPAERLAALAANSWVKVDPQPSKRLVLQGRDENAPVVEVTSREPAFREYTSPAYGGGKVFYFGGGHSGYAGNDIEIYDPAENIWRQCYRPVCPPKDDSTYYSGGSERSYVDPATGASQPYVLHGYARTGYDPALSRYVCTAMFPTKTERDPQTKQWRLVEQAFSYIAFNDKTNRWELLSPVPDALKPGSTSLSFDSDLGAMVAFSERAAHVYRDGKWTPLGPCDVSLAASGGSAAVYLPELKAHVVAVLGHGGAKEVGRLHLYKAGESSPRRIESVPEALAKRIAPGTGGFNLVLSYDEESKRVVVMSANEQNKPDVWLYVVATDRWEHLPLPPSAPQLMGVFEPGRGRAPLVYDPVHKVFFLLARRGETAETWAYRATSRTLNLKP